MSLTKEQVRHVAHLARLALSPEDEERFAQQLGSILGYVERLQTLDVTGVEPLAHAVPMVGGERSDVVRPSLRRDEVLAAAPQRVGEGIAVPRIIE
jgi:aspartyl-tRNA(Asn)/glutamyl-tRNA(Gln) amidotransferase subunit C